MAFTYRSRLRQDLARWEEQGLIGRELRSRLEADAFSTSAFAHVQVALVLCAVILAAVSLIAFVAANWAAISPLNRMALLLAGNAVMVVLTYLAFERRSRAEGSWLWVEAFATLSVAAAAASVALVAQTFHLPADLRGYAVTVATIATLTALISRSGGAAMITAVALTVAVVADYPHVPSQPPALFWPLIIVTFAGSLSGWTAARAATFFFMLIPIAVQLGVTPRTSFVPVTRQDIILALVAVVIAAGHGLVHFLPAGAPRSIKDNLGLAARAAAGLVLLSIALAAVGPLTGIRVPSGTWSYISLGLAVAAATILLAAVRLRRIAIPVADLIVLGAAAVQMLGPLWRSSQGLGPEPALAVANPFWTVWTSIVPSLALAIAGHLDERRALFGWSMAVTAALIVAMLFFSKDLIGFSAHLFVSSLLVAAAVVICRWAEKRFVWRLS